MLLKNKQTGVLIEIIDTQELINPSNPSVLGKIQAGEEEQQPEQFSKLSLLFPSNEALPLCWLDSDYQAKMG